MSQAIHKYFLLGLIVFGLVSCAGLDTAVADRQMASGNYYEASRTYRKLYNKSNPKSDRKQRGSIALKMAEAYRRINQHERAVAAYNNAMRYGVLDSMTYLHLAQSLHATGRYSEAVNNYRRAIEKMPYNTDAETGLKGALEADSIVSNHTRYIVRNFRAVNSHRSDFAPTFRNAGELYFTTTNEKVKSKIRSSVTGMKPSDIWMTKKDSNGKWSRPESVTGELNSDKDEGIICFSPDGNTMYLTSTNDLPGGKTSIAIFTSEREENSWSKPHRINLFMDSTINCGHPALSPSGDYLYFSSDCNSTESKGGKDIWRVSVVNGTPSSPENLGESINTSGNEEFPYILTDSIMFFSSDGHPGLGGLDIFMAELKPSGKWVVTNFGSPVNSPADDFGITFDPSCNNAGFFSSSRGDTRGYDHIYSFELPEIKIRLNGIVIDSDDNPIENAVIRIVGNDGSSRKTATLPDGTFTVFLSPEVSYTMLSGARDYLNARASLTTDDSDAEYEILFRLASAIRPNTIDNILYDFDSAELRPESRNALDSLVAVLNDNPAVTVEFGSHTDRNGSEAYNLKLSERRAHSVVKYLTDAGIESVRLQYKGYGKSNPKTITPGLARKFPQFKGGTVLTPEYIGSLENESDRQTADQINRRTEFKVISTGAINR